MTQQLLDNARSNVRMIEDMASRLPPNAALQKTLEDARENVRQLEQQMGVQAPQQAQEATSAPPTLEQRVSNLEGLVQKAVLPAVDEAAKTGMAIMQALGEAMTPDQAQWVQHRLNNSPDFFASPNCKTAIDIFIQEWVHFEEKK